MFFHLTVPLVFMEVCEQIYYIAVEVRIKVNEHANFLNNQRIFHKTADVCRLIVSCIKGAIH